MRTKISILGSTGSIGENTLNVIAQHPDRFKVVALGANTSFQKLFEQCVQFEPEFAALADIQAALKLQELLSGTNLKTRVMAGKEALSEIASLPEVDRVMSAIVGAQGLWPTLSACRAGKIVLISNKEPLVMAGSLMMQEAKRYGATILPVDSEHNAVFQCLPDDYRTGEPLPASIQKITLTASGGPFWHRDWASFSQITPKEACQHPTWRMGKKISIDSATLMNKGLELIEAHHLFHVLESQLEVIIHPESVVHALVTYTDRSVLSQLGPHDMRTAIAYSLAWPHRIASGAKGLDLIQIAKLHFFAPDLTKFRCLKLAVEVLKAGNSASVVLNASNEVAVHAFLNQQVRFSEIPAIIESVLNKISHEKITSLEEVAVFDECARAAAWETIKTLS